MGGFALLMTAWFAGVSATLASGCCGCGCPEPPHGALYPPQLPVLYYAPLQGGQLVVPVGAAAAKEAHHPRPHPVAEERSYTEVAESVAEAEERRGGGHDQESTQLLGLSESHTPTALLPNTRQAETYVRLDGKESIISQHHPTHYIHVQQLHPQTAHESNSVEPDHDHPHHDKNVRYKYEYTVNDPHTRDVKSHVEERHGDVVEGEYSVLEDDGNVRTVKYYADWKNGFHAQVLNSKKKG